MGAALSPLLAGSAGFAIGWLASRYQHLLYREADYRSQPLAGRRALVARALLGTAVGVCFAIAFRPAHYGPWPAAATAGATAILCTAASTDLERRRIPNRLVYPSLLAAAAIAPIWPDRGTDDIVIGAAVAVGSAIALVLIGALLGAALGAGTTAFGIGDAKLILLIGILAGWPRVAGALLLGVIFGGLPAIPLLFLRGQRTTYSYGPYLALGAIIMLLWPGYY